MKNLFLFIKISSRISKSLIILLIISALLGSAATIFSVYGPKLLIDSLVNEDNLLKSFLIGGIIIIVNFLLAIVNRYLSDRIELASRHVSNRYHNLLGEKVLSIEYSYLEDPYYLDLKERALFACSNQGSIRRIVLYLSEVIKYFITIISLIAILSQLGVLLLLIVLIAVIINAFIVFASARYTKSFYQMLIPINRKFGYYVNTMGDSVKAKDYRLYDANELMIDKFDTYQSEIVNQFKKLFKVGGVYSSLMVIVSSMQSFAVYMYVTYKTIKEKLSIGSFSLYVSSAIQFSTAISNIIRSLTGLWQTTAYITPFLELLSIEEETIGGKIILDKEIESIEFKNVIFKYPRQEQTVLNDISFMINKNERISIVGLNGAGKTTLIKLLCRLYRPTSGNIYVNGIDIFDYDIDSYNKRIACVFQDYKLINYSIKENITCGVEKELDINKIINEVGLEEKINSLSNGIDTHLGKTLDEAGVEMSGGEHQKLAIARAIYKDSSLVVLDEPTSALDPMAEADIYENFNNMVGDKTAIYISHRMSSSVFCDKILVIDSGKISDFDTHKKLMLKNDSLYYKLFNSQATNYQHSK